MILEQFPALQNLSQGDKWRLAEELWEDLLPETNREQDEAIQKLIETRMKAYAQDPQSAVSWDSVKQKMQALRHA